MNYTPLTKIDKLVIGGLVSAGISMQLFPPIFALLGLTLGVITFKEKEVTKGIIVILVSIIFGIVGMILGGATGPISAYEAFLS